MEVAIGANGSTPFQREVREWQRVDPNTGALMSGRLEADRWINGPLNAYGKVVDSQNVSKPNGTQHTQRKQLEVLQARTSSGSLQVVRAQTVQTSSSRWSSSSSSSGTRTTQQSFEGQRFSNGLHLTNGHLLDGHDQHQYQNHQQQQQQLTNHLSSRLLAAPSLKLSSLMKSSPATAATTNGGGRISPHFQQLAGKQHQQPENETTRTSSSLTTSCRYQPTLGEVRVGVGGSTEQMESFRNEREICDSSDSLEQSHYAHLPRGKSISTDDLSTEWDQNEEGDESSEWRRVSKIRRSFQFPKSTSPKLCANRPTDLPENSVSVSRIREELENGRRLSTAMRNNHVDLAALNNILNGTTETGEMKGTKKTSFLTAESLKEIRGRLKKLSDESLYKDDFITQKEEDREHDIMTDLNGGIQVEQPVILQDAQVVQQPDFQYRPLLDSKLATNSLENRMRYRDTTSSEWHLRRKSYGFEQMTPQDHSIFRSEPSTDSGIGRSGELSNWSPTETTPRATIIKFGDNSAPTVMSGHDSSSPKPLVPRRYSASRNSEGEEVKRHSIAVDESKYVRDNLRKVFDTKTSIHLNGLYLKEANSSQVSIGEENNRKQKRVEFCKTEVHFAAESGRVNIVETDGKPPPTNNFRRRRRGSGGSTTSSYLDAMNSGMPVIHFGDEKKTLFEQETAVEEIQAMKNNVTVSLAMTNGFADPLRDDEDENSDEISLRGILKNKPIKPKPYHLGENVDPKDNLWGVRLRPVASDLVTPKVNDEEDVEETKVNLVQEEPPKPIRSVAERVRIVEERKDGSGYSTKINLNLSNSPYAWNPAEVRKSNVMSIDLKSPTQTAKKAPQSPVAISVRSDAPVAHPRTVTSEKTTRSNRNETAERNVYKTESLRSPIPQKPTPVKDKEPLKVVTGGARKLREHELSYFGVKVNNCEEKPRAAQRTATNPEANRKPVERETSSKWNNKPDLLRHSPDGSTNTSSRQDNEKSRPKDGPIYENLKKPSSYSRKKDLQRDEMILNEMTKTADQTLKAVSGNSSQKDHPRRTPQRSTRPLDTIQEVQPSLMKLHQKSMKSKGIQVSRVASEGFQRQCCSNRPSSASSTESLSRLSNSSSVGRSRSRSRDQNEKVDKIEYAAVKQTKKVSSPGSECAKVKTRRSTSHASSSEDLANLHHKGEPRKVKRSKPKEKESSAVRCDVRTKSSTSRANAEADDRNRSFSKTSGYEQVRRSHRSMKDEQAEKVPSSRAKASSSASDYHQKTHTKSSSAVIASTYVSKNESHVLTTRIIPPPRKKRRNKLYSVPVQRSYSSSSFSYFPSANLLYAMKNGEMKNNTKRLHRRKPLGICTCS